MTLVAAAYTPLVDLTKVASERGPDDGVCDINPAEDTARSVNIVYLSVDIFLLGLMVIGLYRRRGARCFSLWRVLWAQGWVWLVIATLSGIPALVCLSVHRGRLQITEPAQVLLYVNVNPVLHLVRCIYSPVTKMLMFTVQILLDPQRESSSTTETMTS